MILDRLDVDPGAFASRTGWVVKPEGACKGDVCVPLPDTVWANDGRLSAEVVSERLGMPLVRDDGARLWALGPASVTGRALETAAVPEDFALPDLDGNPFQLSALRGRKVLLVAWASW